jgi:hypothetical protein
VIDIVDGEAVVDGLAMPHSPRFDDAHVWVLESGKGSLARVDPTDGTLVLETTADERGATYDERSGRTAEMTAGDRV